MIRTLSLRRHARFTVHSCSGSRDNQCGAANTTDFTYTVVITTDPVVDEHGFIIDSLDVKRYFEEAFGNIQGDLPSCERMCMQAATDLAALVGHTCRKVEVQIGTDALAGLSAVWVREAGTVVPDFPDEAVVGIIAPPGTVTMPNAKRASGLLPTGTDLV